jgi:hypothetical protein
MPDKIEHLQRLLRERIVILDGAMGTMIQQRKLDEAAFRGARFADWQGKPLKGLNDLLNLTQPDIIQDIHRQYLEAGADIVETNTFNAQSTSLAEYGMESLAQEIAFAGAECARRAVEQVERGAAPMANWSRRILSRSAACWTVAWTCCWWKRYSTRSIRKLPFLRFNPFLKNEVFAHCLMERRRPKAAKWFHFWRQ